MVNYGHSCKSQAGEPPPAGSRDSLICTIQCNTCQCSCRFICAVLFHFAFALCAARHKLIRYIRTWMGYFTPLGGVKQVTQLCTFLNHSNRSNRGSTSAGFVLSFIHSQPLRCRRKDHFKIIYIGMLKCHRHLRGAGSV
jgi:hypothetical protein